MASIKSCCVVLLVLGAFAVFKHANSSPTVSRELQFESELSAKINIIEDPTCIDQDDCDPYGLYVCTRSPAAKKWSRACCREYCGYCNTTVPKDVDCEQPPPDEE